MSEKDFYLYVDGKPVKVSKDVYRECKHREDKERYFMKRLKKGRFLIDAEAQTVTYIHSREESYERLLASCIKTISSWVSICRALLNCSNKTALTAVSSTASPKAGNSQSAGKTMEYVAANSLNAS